MSEPCPDCGDLNDKNFNPGNIPILQFTIKHNQEPEVTLRATDWNALIHDWLRLKTLANEDLPEGAPQHNKSEEPKIEDKGPFGVRIHRLED